MSLLSQLSPHLPHLRRYARALTGDQAGGDAYVRAALEAVADGAQQLDPDAPSRVALYQVFHAIWSSTGARLESPVSAGTDLGIETASSRLMRIPPRSRQAFLLTAMEGFSRAEAGAILGCDTVEIASLITDAQSDIEAEIATDVLIIEDEPIIAADIEALVCELGHQVTGIATTRAEAVALAAAHPPGLVLADVQLADGSSGIDAAKDILGHLNVPVIFITAFPERLLTGERPEPTFLISKPFQPESVKAAIGQALFFHPAQARQAAA
jgi:DNA-directed RNA polymerase specialized sigma24 family protein/CheY-like chemotaxis protein